MCLKGGSAHDPQESLYRLRPTHADTPQAQLKALHNSPRYVQILRNDLGETLSHYARFAHGVMLGGGFGD